MNDEEKKELDELVSEINSVFQKVGELEDRIIDFQHKYDELDDEERKILHKEMDETDERAERHLRQLSTDADIMLEDAERIRRIGKARNKARPGILSAMFGKK